jgi:hypothetical protein
METIVACTDNFPVRTEKSRKKTHNQNGRVPGRELNQTTSGHETGMLITEISRSGNYFA